MDTLALSTEPPAEARFVLSPTLLLPVVPLMLTVAFLTVTVVPLLWPADVLLVLRSESVLKTTRSSSPFSTLDRSWLH